MKSSYLFVSVLVAGSLVFASVVCLPPLGGHRMQDKPTAAPHGQDSNSPSATEPSAVSGGAFPGESRELGLVEAVANGPAAFEILHVYAGKIAYVGDRCGPGISDYGESGQIAPIATPGQHGLLVVEKDGNGHLQCTVLQYTACWFTNVLDNSDRYKQFKELANDVEAYNRLPREQRVDALRKHANGPTEEIITWAIFIFSREFPDVFASYAQDMIEHDRFTIQQQAMFERATIRVDDVASPLRVKILSKWTKARPSEDEASAITDCLVRETINLPLNGRPLLFRTFVAIALNKAYPIEDRRSIVIEGLGRLARSDSRADSMDALESILSSSDEPTLRDAAAASLARARSLRDRASATHRLPDSTPATQEAHGEDLHF